MELALYVVVILLNIGDILLHIAGIYLLICHFKTNDANIQQLYIVHLSITELLFSILWLFIYITKCIDIQDGVPKMAIQATHYVMIIAHALLASVFYCAIYFITIDRLIACWLPTKYLACWDTTKAKKLLIGMWIIGIILLSLILLLHKLTGIEIERTLHIYLFTPLNIFFVILACFVYAFIFYRYKESQKRRTRVSKNSTGFCLKISTIKIFHKSRFHISVLVILTFIFFIAIPDVSYVFVIVIRNKTSDIFLAFCAISYTISNIFNVIVYIFFQPKIRKSLYTKLKCQQN